MKFQDVELLSAYLDGRLAPADARRLESRLASDAQMHAVLDDLRVSRGLLRKLPQRRAPRNFTLTPRMAGIKAPEPRAYPVFRFATVLATLLFLLTFAVNGIAPMAESHLAAAPAPAYGIGGGGGCSNCGGGAESSAAPAAPALPQAAAAPTEAPAATEAPLQAFAAAPTESGPAQDNARNFGTSTAEAAPKAAPLAPGAVQPLPQELPRQQPVVSIPAIWQIVLAVLAVICGLGAWVLRRDSEQKFHQQWDKR